MAIFLKVDPESLEISNDYTEDYIRKNADNIDFSFISNKVDFNKIPFSCIEDYSDEWDWDIVCKLQILSENFIRKFSHRVNWNRILLYQDVSDDFLIEFKEYFDLDGMTIMWLKFKEVCHNTLTSLLFEQNIEIEDLKGKLEEAFKKFRIFNRVRDILFYQEERFLTCTFQFLSELGEWENFKIQTG